MGIFKRKEKEAEKEVEIEAAPQKSVLTTIKDNLELALMDAVKLAANFIGVEITDEHKIELNENFDLTSMSPDEMRGVSELYEKNQIAWGELREALRRSGIAKMSDEDAQTAIKQDSAFKKAVTPEPIVKPAVGKPNTNPAK